MATAPAGTNTGLTMALWLLAGAMALGAHFAMTFNVPAKTGKAWLGWPFAVGDRGFGGSVRGPAASGPSFVTVLAALTAVGFVSAILSLLSIWLPHTWWPALAAASAIGSLVLMVLFYRPNKLAAIAVDLTVLSVAAATALAATP